MYFWCYLYVRVLKAMQILAVDKISYAFRNLLDLKSATLELCFSAPPWMSRWRHMKMRKAIDKLVSFVGIPISESFLHASCGIRPIRFCCSCLQVFETHLLKMFRENKEVHLSFREVLRLLRKFVGFVCSSVGGLRSELRQWALSLAPEQPPVTTCAATGSKSTGVYNSWTGPVTSFKICQTWWNLVKPGETWNLQRKALRQARHACHLNCSGSPMSF